MSNWPNDPYGRGAFKENPYAAKRPLDGRLVVVLRGIMGDRGLQLIKTISRAVCAGEVHELIATTEEGAAPGLTVNRIAYLGFVEFAQGGVVVSGDPIKIGGRVTGVVAGFDETHAPNHLNIVIRTAEGLSGEELGLKVEDSVAIGGS